MVQAVLIGLLFTGAVVYLGRLLYKAFRPAKTGCVDCKCAESKIITPTK